MIRLTASNSGSGLAVLRWPFDRLHLDEQLGPEAGKLAAERIRDGKLPVAEIRLLDGQAVLVDVTFDGKPIRQIVKP